MAHRHYETFYLLRPDLSEEERSAIMQKFQRVITEQGGEIFNLDPWPLRRLAYRVGTFTEGYYCSMEYGAPPEVIAGLTRTLRLDERVLKFITNKRADKFDREAVIAAHAAKKNSRQEGSAERSDLSAETGPEEE